MTEIDLDRIRIGSPCPMKWEELEGDGRERFCGTCSLHVNNLSEMTRGEAKELLGGAADDGRVCVAMARRADGSIVTADDVAVRSWGGRFRRELRAAAAFLAGFFPFLAGAAALAGCEPQMMVGSLASPEMLGSMAIESRDDSGPVTVPPKEENNGGK